MKMRKLSKKAFVNMVSDLGVLEVVRLTNKS